MSTRPDNVILVQLILLLAICIPDYLVIMTRSSVATERKFANLPISFSDVSVKDRVFPVLFMWVDFLLQELKLFLLT